MLREKPQARGTVLIGALPSLLLRGGGIGGGGGWGVGEGNELHNAH
jgi:hypothetical protein